jgi:GntR family transcriptional regulator
MDFSVSKKPLYSSVKRSILKAIQSGEFSKNKQLPTEKVLAEKFKVSRATIRSALQSLEDDNVIKKQQGVGTFLTHNNFLLKMRIDKVKGFYQLISDIGYEPSIRDESISKEPVSKKSSKILKIPLEEELIVLKRTLAGDDQPVLIVFEYVPVSKLIHEPKLEEIPESIFRFADQFCVERIEYSISEIIPTAATAFISESMSIDENEPILKLEETHFSKTDQPIIFSKVYVNDQHIRFKVVRTRE